MTQPTSVDLALNWLARSEVRHAKGSEIARGGVNQGYNWKTRGYTFVYSEITGYAISTLVAANRWTGEERYLTFAREAADFLLRVHRLAVENGAQEAIPHGLSLPDLKLLPQYYSFDVAMCLQGLLDLYAARPAPDLLELARALGDWLLDRMQQEDGAFLSMYDAESDEWHHPGREFHNDHGCLHAKHAIGLLKLHRATGDERYVAAARRVCHWVLSLQDADGAIRASVSMRQVVSHPHCYAMEGLLYAHHALGEERYLRASLRAGEWLLRAQNRDGSINIAYKQSWPRMGRRITELFFPRRVTDATSQGIRLWLILYYLTNDSRFLDAARNAADFVRGMQCRSSSDENAVGGFYFWPDYPVMFTWATMFAVQALHSLEHVSDGNCDYERLIEELF